MAVAVSFVGECYVIVCCMVGCLVFCVVCCLVFFSGQVAYPDLVMVLVWLIWGAVIKWRENHRGEYTVMRSG